MVADIQAYGVLMGERDLWQQDWASDGLRKGAPPMKEDPPGTWQIDMDKFPWTYQNTGTSADPANTVRWILP
ncbi:MAG: hypothetical protein HY321_20350 [Armatimonadetes bacterium]|nr:hypothetical protein [Armatimonadota bacterium]